MFTDTQMLENVQRWNPFKICSTAKMQVLLGGLTHYYNYFYFIVNEFQVISEKQSYVNLNYYLMIDFRNVIIGSSYCGSVVTNLTSIHEDMGSIPGPAQWVKDLALP